MRDVALAGLVAAGADYAVQRRRTGKQVADDQAGGRATSTSRAEGDPMMKGADPLPPARLRARPDDGRRTPGRRRAGQPHPRGGRAAATTRPRAPRGSSPRAPAPRRSASRTSPPSTGSRCWRTSRWPGPSTRAPRSATASPLELFRAVAEVLAVVYAAKRRGSRPTWSSRDGHRMTSPTQRQRARRPARRPAAARRHRRHDGRAAAARAARPAAASNITLARRGAAHRDVRAERRWTSRVFPALLLVTTLFRLALNICVDPARSCCDGDAGQGHRRLRRRSSSAATSSSASSSS